MKRHGQTFAGMAAEMLRRLVLLATLALAALGPVAHAEVVAEPLPGDPNLVVFPFDANNSYRIFTRPRTVTHIVLEEDERVKVLALGDTVSWEAQKRDNHVFIKARYTNRTTSGTLVTNKREYQLLIVSTGDEGRFYQRVSWMYPDMMQLEEQAQDRQALERAIGTEDAGAVPNGGEAKAQGGRQGRSMGGARGTEANAQESTSTVNPAQLNFSYHSDGDASFRPVRVYDDGRTTWIRLPEGAEMPAVFQLRKGELEIVDYTLDGPTTLVIPQVMTGIVLKIGSEEVRIANESKNPPGLLTRLFRSEK